jgi:hypothetical protein
MGIQRGGLYLDGPGASAEAIRRFFRLRIEASLDRGRPLGCLLTNSAVEMSGGDRRDAARIGASLETVERAFRRALERARDVGEVDPGCDVRALARFRTSSAQGLSVMARAVPVWAVLEDVAGVVLAVRERDGAAVARGGTAGRARRRRRGKGLLRLDTDGTASPRGTRDRDSRPTRRPAPGPARPA